MASSIPALSIGELTPTVIGCSASLMNPTTASYTPSDLVARPTSCARTVYQRTTGPVLAPMSAFLLLQGIETVALRRARHVENAQRVAHFLRADPRIARVDYVGFAQAPTMRSPPNI